MASGDGKAGWDRDSSSGTACVWTENDKGAGGKMMFKNSRLLELVTQNEGVCRVQFAR